MKKVITFTASLFLVFVITNTTFAQSGEAQAAKPIGNPAAVVAPMADLVPVSNSQVMRGGFLIFYIENKGTKEASASVTEVRYKFNGGYKVELVNTPKVAPGARVKLTIRYALETCDNTTITTDIAKTVTESDEINNLKKFCWVD